MPASIPASAIVAVNPSVISAGGLALALNGLALTDSVRVPIGSIAAFPTALAVHNYFGATSTEAAIADVYFGGFDGATERPGQLLFFQYNTANVAAYLRGGDVSKMALTALQALSGVLTVTVDGVVTNSSNIDLTGVTSFSNAAQLINAALGVTGAQVGAVTGSITATTLTVTAVTSGALAVGDVIAGTGVTAGTYITAFGTGTGGTGTYTVSASQTVASTAITATEPAVTYDSLAGAFQVKSPTTGSASNISYGSGTIAAGLKLDQADGAITSQGANTAVPATAMDKVIALTQNWATFFTSFEPNAADKEAFAAWTDVQDNRYAYIMKETGITATQANPTTLALYSILAANYAGVIPVYEPSDLHQDAFISGVVASIDFTQPNGRTNLAFRSQTGLLPGVTDQTVADQLIANGYNFYGAYATATTGYNFLYPGSVTGLFLWADSYINQIWLNTALQQALMTLLTSVKSVPYNDLGYNLIRQACADPILAAVAFGAIREGVPLSALQAAEVNAAAGLKIDNVLSTRGWYLQILPATAQVRAARGSPPMNLWYMDGQSVQKISLASVEVQ